MLKLKSEKLELRGIQDATSAKGNLYYTVFCESESGEPFRFFCKDSNAFAQGLKKGDSVYVTLSLNKYNNLVVEKIEKVGA